LRGREVPCAAKASLVSFTDEIQVQPGKPLELTLSVG
jgi:hypothetical protein